MRIKSRRFRNLVLTALFAGLAVSAPKAQAARFSDEGKIVLASLTTTVPSDQAKDQSGLFGAGEQRYSDLSAFTKWTGVLKKFKKELPANLKKAEVKKWMKFLASLKEASRKEKIKAVNEYMNKIQFMADKNNYGVNDYWATPVEFLTSGKGDCEDYAIAKFISLRALGFSQDEMRLAIVYDNVMQMPHALLVVYDGDEKDVLDNQNPEVTRADDGSRYKPIYSISQLAWWRH